MTPGLSKYLNKYISKYICSGYVEDNCFDSSWMLQPSLTYSDRPIQRKLYPGAIPTKLQHKPVTGQHISKQ